MSDQDSPESDATSLWDDDAFVARVKRAAREKRMPLSRLAQMAGVSDAWLRSPARGAGRGIDYILRIASALQMDAAELMGLREARLGGDLTKARRLRRLSVAAGLLYVALDRQEEIEDVDIEAALSAIRVFIEDRSPEDQAA